VIEMIKNILQPTGDQVRGFRDRKTGEPIQMLNLLKFKDKAEYDDGRETDLTGRQAYALYGKGFERVMGPEGATVLYSGEVKGFLIGEGEGSWDAMALIQYPSTDVMLAMFRNEEYQKEQAHRAAGLEGQLLIECGPGFSFS
jgi:uncharacterized protein (DUF1330 family)